MKGGGVRLGTGTVRHGTAPHHAPKRCSCNTIGEEMHISVDDAATMLVEHSPSWQFAGAADELLSKDESELADLLQHETGVSYEVVR